MSGRCSRRPGSNPLSGKTSSVKKSRSCSTPGSSGRFTTHGDWPTLLSSTRLVGSFGCASTTPVSISHAPKDPFPLPRIDQIIDSTSGCDLLCFLDAYSGFHQISMSREDEEHTVFITVDDIYCYTFKPYLMVLRMLFLPLCMPCIRYSGTSLDIVEVYVDDIIVKIKYHISLLDNLSLVFDRLRSTCTKLNPDKYVFGVSARKLLGFLVSHRGIETNPEKIKTIEVMWPPARIKDVKKLTRCLAALSQFISRLAERALLFFKLL
jgi:hypothetical protein